jgi:50S ribosome-binding GTPase/GTP-binding protein TrmE-like protein
VSSREGVRELTPRGAGGISVLRIEGAGAIGRLRRLSAKLAGAAPRPGDLELVRLSVHGEALDEALVAWTSEESAELHVHGSPPLVARLIELLGAGEASPAPAVALEDRARELLARAPCEAAARILLDQSEGALRRELEVLASSEDAPARIDRLLRASREAAFALRPARVVLAGPVNAGKSTLFNALVGWRRVAVSAAPGTTRDVIVERAQLGEWPVDLSDTAGERPAAGSGELDAAEMDAAKVDAAHGNADEGALADLERAGCELGERAREDAELVLWLEPAGGPRVEPPPGARAVVRVQSCADRLPPAERLAPWIAALGDPARAVRTVAELFRVRFGLPEQAWRPGAPIAFDDALVAGLVAAREAPSRPARIERFAALVALQVGARAAPPAPR